MELKDLIKLDRTEKALTQEEYAKKVGITRSTLSHLESGSTAGSETLKKLSKYFNKPILELIGEKKINNLCQLETTNILIDNLISRKHIKYDKYGKLFINDAAMNLILESLKLEIELKLEGAKEQEEH